MFVEYLIVVSVVTAIALTWRALLLDHPKLLAFVESLPVVGGALRCGFCAAMWFTLVGVIIYNPIAGLFSNLHWTIILFFSWMVTSVGVLFLRNLLTVLMEGTGVLTDKHRRMHDDH